jgi:hypothetical protein
VGIRVVARCWWRTRLRPPVLLSGDPNLLLQARNLALQRLAPIRTNTIEPTPQILHLRGQTGQPGLRLLLA